MAEKEKDHSAEEEAKKAHQRWLELQERLRSSSTAKTNAAVIQALANLCREDEGILDRAAYNAKKKGGTKNDTDNRNEVPSFWRRRFLGKASVPTNNAPEEEGTLMSRFAKQQYSPKPEEPKMTFSENVQDMLLNITSQFESQINEAFRSDPVMKKGQDRQKSSLGALLNFQQLKEVDKNMKAIDHDMKKLQKAKEKAAEALEKKRQQAEIGDSDEYYDDDDDDDDDEEDDSSDEDDDDDDDDDSDSDDDDEYSSDEDDSDYDEDDSEYWDSDDSSSLESFDGLVDDMQEQLGIIVPDQFIDSTTGIIMSRPIIEPSLQKGKMMRRASKHTCASSTRGGRSRRSRQSRQSRRSRRSRQSRVSRRKASISGSISSGVGSSRLPSSSSSRSRRLKGSKKPSKRKAARALSDASTSTDPAPATQPQQQPQADDKVQQQNMALMMKVFPSTNQNNDQTTPQDDAETPPNTEQEKSHTIDAVSVLLRRVFGRRDSGGDTHSSVPDGPGRDEEVERRESAASNGSEAMCENSTRSNHDNDDASSRLPSFRFTKPSQDIHFTKPSVAPPPGAVTAGKDDTEGVVNDLLKRVFGRRDSEEVHVHPTHYYGEDGEFIYQYELASNDLAAGDKADDNTSEGCEKTESQNTSVEENITNEEVSNDEDIGLEQDYYAEDDVYMYAMAGGFGLAPFSFFIPAPMTQGEEQEVIPNLIPAGSAYSEASNENAATENSNEEASEPSRGEPNEREAFSELPLLDETKSNSEEASVTLEQIGASQSDNDDAEEDDKSIVLDDISEAGSNGLLVSFAEVRQHRPEMIMNQSTSNILEASAFLLSFSEIRRKLGRRSSQNSKSSGLGGKSERTLGEDGDPTASNETGKTIPEEADESPPKAFKIEWENPKNPSPFFFAPKHQPSVATTDPESPESSMIASGKEVANVSRKPPPLGSDRWKSLDQGPSFSSPWSSNRSAFGEGSNHQRRSSTGGLGVTHHHPPMVRSLSTHFNKFRNDDSHAYDDDFEIGPADDEGSLNKLPFSRGPSSSRVASRYFKQSLRSEASTADVTADNSLVMKDHPLEEGAVNQPRNEMLFPRVSFANSSEKKRRKKKKGRRKLSDENSLDTRRRRKLRKSRMLKEEEDFIKGLCYLAPSKGKSIGTSIKQRS